VIVLRDLTKVFPDQPRPAVDRLDLEVEAGETCVLIGPSGCGKTTTMRMINRLVQPTSGTVEVDGRDTSRLPPVELRRSIGYVIQQIGLFPHMTIAHNVATVPSLLAWPPARIRERVDEMLDLVGLEPRVYRGRFPRELSGGERQRVGVARALAGNPPVMLMDEPFAAVDPITRSRLQAEFHRIFRALGKTIVFVTHDMDEAIRMGDRIAIMRDGRLVQHGTPDDVLAHPADEFVEEFVGSDRALKRLMLVSVRELMRPDTLRASVRGEPASASVPLDATLDEALSAMLASGLDALPVTDGERHVVGVVSLADIRRLSRARRETPRARHGTSVSAG
jgi:osmoprotectant transport system ATP-binding protein